MLIKKLFAWRDWSIATKLSILFAGTALVTLIAFAYTEDSQVRAQVVAEARILNLQRARATAQLLDLYLVSVDTNVQLLAVAPGTVEFLLNPLDATRREEMMVPLRVARERGGYDAAFILNPSGTVLLATDARLAGRNYTTAPWFRNATAGRATFDEPRYDAVDGKVYLHISAPVRTPRGEIVGALVARLTLEPLDTIIAADVNYDGSGASGVLSDENGIRLSHSLRQDLRYKPFAPLSPDLLNEMIFEARYGPDTATILGSPTDFVEFVRRGKQLFFESQTDPYVNVNSLSSGPVDLALAPLMNKRWIYSIGTPQAGLLAQVNQQTKISLLQALSIGAIALIVSLLGTHWVTRPLRRVADGANALAAGDLSRRIGLNQHDEVGQLSAAFDAMAEALEQKDAALRKHTAQLEDTNRELEAFTYSISHDLRAPLRAIDGYTRILLEDYAAAFDDAGKHLGLVVRAETQRMSRLINDLLALSRLNATEMRLAPIDMQALVQSIFDRLTTPEARARIDLRMDALPIAEGDAVLIQRVWENLLANALKFSSKRERAVIQVSGAVTADQVTYTVRDNGAGFDPQYAKKLFGVFQRLHSDKEFEGTGVGLAIVQRVIHRHGGRVGGESQADAGATFWFTLPIQRSSND